MAARKDDALRSLLLQFCPSEPESPEPVASVDSLVEASDRFSEANTYPIETTLLKTLRPSRGDAVLLDNANGAYPLVHEEVLRLCLDFLALKRAHGSEVERGVYRDLTLEGLVDRLLVKRPLVFVGERDRYMLRDAWTEKDGAMACYKDKKTGEMIKRRMTPTSGYGGFEKIGTKEEEAPLLMRDYITYDEMKLSALLATCSPTCTINAGERHNKGRVEDDEDKFIGHAFICGLVGTREGGREETRGHCAAPFQVESQSILNFYWFEREFVFGIYDNNLRTESTHSSSLYTPKKSF